MRDMLDFGASLPRRLGVDPTIAALKGFITIPEAAVGLADMVSGGRVGRALERRDGTSWLAFDPEQAKRYLDSWYSDQHKAGPAAVEKAVGVLDTAIAVLSHPSLVATSVLESVPLMLAGGAVGRGLSAATKFGPAATSAIGEGVLAAASGAESVRQATPDRLLTGEQAGIVAETGIATAVIGRLGNRIAQTLGIADIDTAMAAAATSPVAARNLASQIVLAAFQEGGLEELPQSVVEQVQQNRALGKPLSDGVDAAAVLGFLAGATAGAGMQLGARLVDRMKPSSADVVKEGVGGAAASEIVAEQVAKATAEPVRSVAPPAAPTMRDLVETPVDAPVAPATASRETPSAESDFSLTAGITDDQRAQLEALGYEPDAMTLVDAQEVLRGGIQDQRRVSRGVPAAGDAPMTPEGRAAMAASFANDPAQQAAVAEMQAAKRAEAPPREVKSSPATYTVTTDGVGTHEHTSSSSGVYAKVKSVSGKITHLVLNESGYFALATEIDRRADNSDPDKQAFTGDSAVMDFTAQMASVATDLKTPEAIGRRARELILELVQGSTTVEQAKAEMQQATRAEAPPREAVAVEIGVAQTGLQRVPVGSIWYDRRLNAEAGPFEADEAPPIIIEATAGKPGRYEVIDGHHRMAAARTSGVDFIAAIIPTPEELEQSRDFGDGEMDEDEWIDWLQARHEAEAPPRGQPEAFGVPAESEIPAGENVDTPTTPAVEAPSNPETDRFLMEWMASDLREMPFQEGGVTRAMLSDAEQNYRPGDADGNRYGIGVGAARVAGTPLQEMFKAAGITGSRAAIAHDLERYLSGEMKKPTKSVLAALRLAPAMNASWDGTRFNFNRLTDEQLAASGIGSRKDFRSPVTLAPETTDEMVRARFIPVPVADRVAANRGLDAAGRDAVLDAEERGAAPDDADVSFEPDALETAETDADIKVRTLAQVDADPDGYVDRYLNAWPRVLSADNASELFHEYSASDDTRATKVKAVRAAASKVIEHAFDRLIARSVPPNRKKVVLFTSGGNGSGKSSTIPKDGDEAFTWDTTASRLEPTAARIEQALKAGYRVELQHVSVDPREAFTRAIVRAKEEGAGRTVTIGGVVSTHDGARKVARALAERYAGDPRVTVGIEENATEGELVTRDLDWLSAQEYPTGDVLRSSLREILDSARDDGFVTDTAYRGFLGADATPGRRTDQEAEQTSVPRPDARPTSEAEPVRGTAPSGRAPEATDDSVAAPRRPILDARGDPARFYHATAQGNRFGEFTVGRSGAVFLATSKRGARMGASAGGPFSYATVRVEAAKPVNTPDTPVHFLDVSKALRDGDAVYVEDESGISLAIADPSQASIESWSDDDANAPVLDSDIDDLAADLTKRLDTTGENRIARKGTSQAWTSPRPFTAENLAEAFGITQEQAVVVYAIADAIGLPLDQIEIVKGGDPASETMAQGGRLRGQTVSLSALRARGFDTDTPYYHQTAATSVEPITREGFDLSKGRARLSDEGVPDGVFFKSNSRDIGVGASGLPGQETAQVPVYLRLGRVARFADRAALERRLSRDDAYAGMVRDLRAYDATQARIFDKRFDEQADMERGEFAKATKALDAWIETWKAENDRLATKARARATELLSADGIETIIIEKDRGSFGRATDTVIAIGEDQVALAVPAGQPSKVLFQNGRSLFDDEDLLDTGEIQKRLPGDVGAVRDEERPTPKLAEAPEFRLTSEVSTRKAKQNVLFQMKDGSSLLSRLFQSAWHGSPQFEQRQSGADGAKASVEFVESGKALLRALTDPNVSSPTHEIAHIERRWLLNRDIAPEHRRGISDEDITTTEKWAGVKDGKWDTPAEEKFARGFERYLRDGGPALPSSLREVFAKMAVWLTDIYQSVTGSAIDVEITPEMRQVFDRLVTRKERLASEAKTKAEASGPPKAPPLDIPAHRPYLRADMKPSEMMWAYVDATWKSRHAQTDLVDAVVKAAGRSDFAPGRVLPRREPSGPPITRRRQKEHILRWMEWSDQGIAEAAKEQQAAPKKSGPPSMASTEPWQQTRAEFKHAEMAPYVDGIKAALAKGKTIANSTSLRVTPLRTPDHIRLTDAGSVQIPQGRSWVTLTDDQVFNLARQAGMTPPSVTERQYHREFVLDGIKAGKPVPDAVRAEYARDIDDASDEPDSEPADTADDPLTRVEQKARARMKDRGTTDVLFQSDERQTDTPAFKRWFGNSQVADADGDPLRVYHGTNEYKDFDTFKRGSRGILGAGIYFTDKPDVAGTYAMKGDARNARTLPVYLRINRPLVIEGGDGTDVLLKAIYGRDSVFQKREAKQGNLSFIITAADIAKVKAKDHDGIIWKHPAGNEYVVFDQQQIKSAIGNQGTFDNRNPSILYQDTEPLPLTRDDRDDLVVIGAAKLARGLDRKAWDAAMRREFGGKVTPFLSDLHTQAAARAKVAKEVDVEDYFNLRRLDVSPAEKAEISDAILETIYRTGRVPKERESWETIRAEAKEMAPEVLEQLKPFQQMQAPFRAVRLIARERIATLNQEVYEGRLALEGIPGDAPEAIQRERVLATKERDLQGLMDVWMRQRSEDGRNLAMHRMMVGSIESWYDPTFWRSKARRELGLPVGTQLPTDVWRALQDILGRGRTAVETGQPVEPIQLELSRFLTRLKKSTFWETVVTIWKAGLLTGLMTHKVNFISNTTFAVAEEVAKAPAVLVDMAVGTLTGRRTVHGISARAVAAAGRHAATKGIADAVAVLKTGTTADDLLRVDHRRELNSGIKWLDLYASTVFRTLAASDRVFKSYAFRRSMEEQAALEAINHGVSPVEILANPPQEMIARAIADAEFQTFNNPNVAAGALAQGRSWLRRHENPSAHALALASDFVLPFSNTPSNVIARLVDYATGLLSGTARAAWTTAFNRSMNAEQQRTLALALGRGSVGAAMMYLGWMLAMAGLATGLDDDDEGDRNVRNAAGMTAGSIKIGGVWYQTNRMAPVGTLIALGASLQRRSTKSFTDEAQRTAKVIGVGTGLVLSFPMLQGLNSIIEGLKRPESAGDGVVLNFAGSVVPTVMRDIASWFDPYRREARAEGAKQSLFAAVSLRLPGLRNQLPARINILGEQEMNNAPAIWSPTIATVARDLQDDVLRELIAHDVGIAWPRQTKDETAETYRKRVVDTGAEIKLRVSRLIASPSYRRQKDDKQAEMIGEAIDESRRRVRERQKKSGPPMRPRFQ